MQRRFKSTDSEGSFSNKRLNESEKSRNLYSSSERLEMDLQRLLQRNNGKLFIVQKNMSHTHPLHPDYQKTFGQFQNQKGVVTTLNMLPAQTGASSSKVGNINAFAPLTVQDNNYFSSYYFPGSLDLEFNKFSLFAERPVFTILYKPRPGCKLH